MPLEFYSVVLCALALPFFAYVQWRRREANYYSWIAFWALLLTRATLLAALPLPGTFAWVLTGAYAIAAAGMLLYYAWQQLAAARPGMIGVQWRHGLWSLMLAALALALAPPPVSDAAPYALGLVLSVAIWMMTMAGGWPLRILAATAAYWGLAVAPHFPLESPKAAVLVPTLLAWAMLCVVSEQGHRDGVAAVVGGEQAEMFRQSVRRSREFEILTQIGTALSSSLDTDALLATIHTQLQKLMDVRNFYVAFQDLERGEIRFDFEVEDGVRVAQRRRPRINALTEHIISTGQAVLITRDLAAFARANGLVRSGRAARTYLGVPVLLQGQPCGVIAVQSHEREGAYDAEHLRVLAVLAAQAGVALENARLFAAVQRDAGQKEFLNHIARLSISTLSAKDMLDTVAKEIARAFNYDHIAVLLLHPASEFHEQPELEIEASADSHPQSTATPQRFALGLAAQAAQTCEMQAYADAPADAIAAEAGGRRCAQARSGLALPIRYGGKTLGVLQLESHTPLGFPADQILVLRTLADQIAVALNHATVFQQMQHQAITDSLTGLKTRRFFMEALHAEWRRARAAEANGEHACFCVVLLDLDQFKPLNDSRGHSEGDRILVRVARVLEQKCRGSSVVARYGGDEFTILVPECEPEYARLLPQRLAAALAEDPVLAETQVRGCFGLAVFPDSGLTPEELLHHADADMYRAKPGLSRAAALR